MKFICIWLIFIPLCTNCLLGEGKIFHVSDYGAYPNDQIDDTEAIQAAVNAAINYTFDGTISFGSGIYNLSSPILITSANNLTITGQGMDQTFLVGNVPMTLFFAQYCNGLTIRSLSIDFDPLPFTAGYVVAVNDTYLDVQVQPPHRTDVNRQVLGIHRFDPVEMRPAFGPNTYEIYQIPPANMSTSIVSPGVLRIPLQFRTKFAVGEAVVVIYGPRHDAIEAHNLEDFTIQSVTLFTSWYMGIRTTRARRLNIVDYHVKPHTSHWLSINADCMHFSDSREYIRISDSKCEMQGDDGLHVHAQYFLVTEIVNSSALIVTAFNWTDPLNIGNGRILEFSRHNQPFSVYSNGTVASSAVDPPMSRLFTFTSPVNVSIGDYACIADTPSVTIRNLTVENNRARGLVFETRNIDIRNSVFNRTSAPAILFQPSLYWHDGPTSRNATLADNLYINCNEGIGQKEGIITVFPFPVQLVPVIDDIRIESSTFLFGNYSQGIIQSANANNLYLTGNYIATNNSTPLISICNSRNITASNNTVVDTQSKIDQYYTLDQTRPCHTNLSSLIDLPPSAFNSSFPPPVSLLHLFFYDIL
jgi:hypothetical protein